MENGACLSFDQIMSIIELFISVANIVVIIWVFKSESKNTERIRGIEKRNMWYSILGISNIAKDFSDMLDSKRDEIISVCRYKNNGKDTKIKKQEEIVYDVSKYFRVYKRNISIAVNCFDKRLRTNIDNQCSEVEDKISGLINKFSSALNDADVDNSIDEIKECVIELCSIIVNSDN